MISVSRNKRVDWPRVIANLNRLGMNNVQIAAAIDCSHGAVREYGGSRGDLVPEPQHWVGMRLVLLWSEKTGLPWTDVPTRAVTPSVSRVLRESA
jgi:hypothetical protein